MGSHTCDLNDQYKNDEIVFHIDECTDESGACYINAECQNINGSYTCACDHGFHGDGRACSNIN